jgi:uncharacterized protein
MSNSPKDPSVEDAAQSHKFTKGLYGWITHTELASADAKATREWCASVLGWQFMPSFPTPSGEYHLFAYSEKGGGGIRSVVDGEHTGSTPFIHVANTDESFAKALKEGAKQIMSPTTQMPGVRTALVQAPGGVMIGFSGPSE